MVYRSTCPSPLGLLTLASDGDALTGLWVEGQKYFGLFPEPPLTEDALPVFREARRWLEAYFAGERPDPRALPLAPQGSPFRHRVWQLLLDIPYGETAAYGELAARLGSSPRAVGGAVGHNPISLIIPCHRVLGAGGALTGYAGGLERKLWLLRHEGAVTGGIPSADR